MQLAEFNIKEKVQNIEYLLFIASHNLWLIIHESLIYNILDQYTCSPKTLFL